MTNEVFDISINAAASLRNSIDNIAPRPQAPGQQAPPASFKVPFRTLHRLAMNRNRLHAIVEPAEAIIQTAIEKAREGLKDGEPLSPEVIRELNAKQKELFDAEVKVELCPIELKDFDGCDDPRILPLLVSDGGRMFRDGKA